MEHRTISRVLKLFYVIFTCSFPKAIMKRSFKSRVNSAGNFIHSAESWKATRKGQNPQKYLFWVFSFEIVGSPELLQILLPFTEKR